MAKFLITDIGTLVHPWVNKADTKFNADGLYHTDFDDEGPSAEALASKIDQAAQAYLDEVTAEMKPGDAKKWTVFKPYERLEDDNGEATGVIRFTFKQNAKIKTKSGLKEIKIELRDSADKIIDVPVWSGSEGRIMFTMRGIQMSQSKQAGVRLDMAKVQITKLASGGSSQGFGAVEGGFEADASQAGFGGDQAEDQGGDY